MISTTGDDEIAEGPNRDAPFFLPKSWTAWPMLPDHVPREELLPRVGKGGDFRAKLDTRPSSNLEEWIVATATRLARERWNTRRWDAGHSDVRTKRDIIVDHGESEKMDVEHGESELDDDASSIDRPEDEDQEDDSTSLPEDADFPMFSSRAFSPFMSSAGSAVDVESDEGSVERDRRAIPLADDEKARQHFLPSTRHILSNLDSLLLGLHKARSAYAAKPPGKVRGRHSHTPGERSGSERRARSRSRTDTRTRKNSSSANSSASVTSATSSKRSRRVRDLNPRDWADVMGMAALTGWSPAVVERASERCARLFGENMMFRTFHEGNAKERNASYFTEHLALESESSDESPERGQGPRQSCPHESCPRHTIPFRDRWHLQRHLARAHGNPRAESRLRTKSSPSSAWSSVDVSDVDIDDVGYVDGITCPVPQCPRNKEVFSEGRLLYDHVRRMHPAVDVKEVKRLESWRRRERRRGRKVGSRSRSVGGSRSRSTSRRVNEAVSMDEEE